MIFKSTKDIKFSYFYRKLNILSSIFIILSILVLLFKGLNLGVDFKGGTLIELRTENSTTNIAEIRQSFLKMKLGDVTVKRFGKENEICPFILLLASKHASYASGTIIPIDGGKY